VGAHDTSDSRSAEIIGTTVVLKSRGRFSAPRIGARTVADGGRVIIKDLVHMPRRMIHGMLLKY
jgi:hypothetical protein